jgi:hypothetical protein
MSLFGQEGIGRPDLEAEAEIKAVKKFLSKSFEEHEIPNVQAVLVFLNEQVEIQANDAPHPALKIDQLKSFMRQKAKERPIPATSLVQIKTLLAK